MERRLSSWSILREAVATAVLVVAIAAFAPSGACTQQPDRSQGGELGAVGGDSAGLRSTIGGLGNVTYVGVRGDSESPSVVAAVLLGVAVSFASFCLKELIQAWRARKRRSNEYGHALAATMDELRFYLGTLKQLEGEANAILLALSAGKPFSVPTYSLYPSFIEHAKMDLGNFHRSSGLVGRVSRCHFELCHVSERLTRLKAVALVRTPAGASLAPENVRGFVRLITENIQRFEQTIESLAAEVDKMGIGRP